MSRTVQGGRRIGSCFVTIWSTPGQRRGRARRYLVSERREEVDGDTCDILLGPTAAPLHR